MSAERFLGTQLRKHCFGMCIPIQNTVLATLFVIENEVKCEPRIAWPLRIDWSRTVADKVPLLISHFRIFTLLSNCTLCLAGLALVDRHRVRTKGPFDTRSPLAKNTYRIAAP